MSASSTDHPLANETTRVGDHSNQHFDLEKGNGGVEGAALGRQFSVQLTAEQFERLYLQPGGVAAKGDLAKYLMGWSGSTTDSAVVAVGAFYYVGGVGLYLSGLLEWIIGNTFPATVFMTFGGYWLAFAFLYQASLLLSEARRRPTTTKAQRCIWFVYLIASLRTNVVFALLFTFLDITFWIFVAVYVQLGYGHVTHVPMELKAAGAFAFLTSACGWYLLVVLIFGSTGIPIALPVGDLSNFMSGRRKAE
ncbi:BZ3500_MvSof-1268-A1-R1_Chr12-2g03900 [Microbotryum saponariae]|uniref:BZ3500_MvSof-1268-A1-R1_Chr12-2g03900 protein n=1 Tax=Microbotryum saponariae TaxID=289078 RepID=A0A2X0KLG8_9BASI|nr:BZ3500_MvSof-1268-A1-R1_Chr12-2g03900 [Microbotryum saponariae]